MYLCDFRKVVHLRYVCKSVVNYRYISGKFSQSTPYCFSHPVKTPFNYLFIILFLMSHAVVDRRDIIRSNQYLEGPTPLLWRTHPSMHTRSVGWWIIIHYGWYISIKYYNPIIKELWWRFNGKMTSFAINRNIKFQILRVISWTNRFNWIQRDLILILVNFTCEVEKIMTRYDFLEARWVISSN